VAEER